MAIDTRELKGVVRGNLIELEGESGLPDGQRVKVTVRPLLPPGEGIRRSAGAWAEDATELDSFLAELRQSRKQDRPEPPA